MDFLNVSMKDKKLYYETIADIENTIKAYPRDSSVFIDNTMNEKISLFPTLHVYFPDKAALFAITYPYNTVEGRRIYFVEKNCGFANMHTKKSRWRMSSLIVSECDRDIKRN